MKTLLITLMVLLGAGLSPLRAVDVAPGNDPDLPKAVSPDDLIPLFTASPFTRSLNLSDSLILTGVAYYDSKPLVTVMNKTTRETFVVGHEPNAMGWRLIEMNATNGQLTRSQAKIMVGSETITVRYSEDQLTPETMKKGGFKPGGGTTEQNAIGGGRSDGPRRDSKGPSDEDRARFSALSDKSREKFIEEMRKNMPRMMNASPEERRAFGKTVFERIEAEDKANRGGR